VNARQLMLDANPSSMVWILQCVDDTRDVTQNRQQNVDEEIGIATSFEEDTKRWENDGKDDLADVAVVGSCVSKPMRAEDDGSARVQDLRCGERHGGGY
jgi:hypothetical protein